MNIKWTLLVAVLGFVLLTTNALAGQNAPSDPVSSPHQKVAEQLALFADTKLESINANIQPSKHSKEVLQEDGEYVARYLWVDTKNITTSLKHRVPSNKFIGIIRYCEMEYQSRGKTPADALAGRFSLVKQRNITEIVRYAKGSWL